MWDSQSPLGASSHLIEPLEEAVFVLRAPRLPLPTGSLLVPTLLLFLSRPLAPLRRLGNASCGAGHRLSHCPVGRRAIFCPCDAQKQRETKLILRHKSADQFKNTRIFR